MALLPAHLLQHLEPQVLVSQLLLGEVKTLGFLRREERGTWAAARPVLPLAAGRYWGALWLLTLQTLRVKPWWPPGS